MTNEEKLIKAKRSAEIVNIKYKQFKKLAEELELVRRVVFEHELTQLNSTHKLEHNHRYPPNSLKRKTIVRRKI